MTHDPLTSIAIYGAGGNGQLVYKALKKQNISVRYFIDLYSDAESYDNIPIYRPNQVPYSGEQVLISVSCISETIKQELEKLNINNCLNMNEIIQTYPTVHDEFISDKYKHSLQESVKNDHTKLQWLASLLDTESLTCLEKIIAYRTNPSAETYVENDWQLQYFPNWLLAKNPWQETGIRMIDCGAYTGDTLVVAKKTLDSIKVESQHYVCFEPDANNYKVIQEYLLNHTFNNQFTVHLYPSGVWCETTLLHFTAGASQGKIDLEKQNYNDVTIPVTSLDESCFGFATNFIKMDIEGAEPEAINGAKKIIQTYKPILAISIYHEPAHLWSIAEQILAINPNYEFKLHVHGDFGLEIILYALPI